MSEKVMFDSEEAATYRTDIKGWVSRTGRFWGDDERSARYDGSTHRNCEECGTEHETQNYCYRCHVRKRNDRFNNFPVEQWDGVTPLNVSFLTKSRSSARRLQTINPKSDFARHLAGQIELKTISKESNSEEA